MMAAKMTKVSIMVILAIIGNLAKLRRRLPMMAKISGLDTLANKGPLNGRKPGRIPRSKRAFYHPHLLFLDAATCIQKAPSRLPFVSPTNVPT
jgi:hypothetical protein